MKSFSHCCLGALAALLAGTAWSRPGPGPVVIANYFLSFRGGPEPIGPALEVPASALQTQAGRWQDPAAADAWVSTRDSQGTVFTSPPVTEAELKSLLSAHRGEQSYDRLIYLFEVRLSAPDNAFRAQPLGRLELLAVSTEGDTRVLRERELYPQDFRETDAVQRFALPMADYLPKDHERIQLRLGRGPGPELRVHGVRVTPLAFEPVFGGWHNLPWTDTRDPTPAHRFFNPHWPVTCRRHKDGGVEALERIDWWRRDISVGHEGLYPEIGPYDQTDPDLLRYHIRQARAAGIDGFKVYTYYPTRAGSDHSPEDLARLAWPLRSFSRMLDLAAEEGFGLFIDDSGLETADYTLADAVHNLGLATRAGFLEHPGYLRIHGRPLYGLPATRVTEPEELHRLVRELNECFHGHTPGAPDLYTLVTAMTTWGFPNDGGPYNLQTLFFGPTTHAFTEWERYFVCDPPPSDPADLLARGHCRYAPEQPACGYGVFLATLLERPRMARFREIPGVTSLFDWCAVGAMMYPQSVLVETSGQYRIHGSPDPTVTARAFREYVEDARRAGYAPALTVSPGHDKSNLFAAVNCAIVPRTEADGVTLRWRRLVRDALAAEPDLLLIENWNGYGEAVNIEPSVGFRDDRSGEENPAICLEILAEALGRAYVPPAVPRTIVDPWRLQAIPAERLEAVSGDRENGMDEKAVTALEGPVADTSASGPRLEVAGVYALPHLKSPDIAVGSLPARPLGVRLEVFVRNPAPTGGNGSDVVLNEVRFNGRYPLDYLIEGAWSWHDTPNLWPGTDRHLPAGQVSVWVVNINSPHWEPGEPLVAEVSDWRNGAEHRLELDPEPNPLRVTSVTCTGTPTAPGPDRVIVHVDNGLDETVTLERARLWLPAPGAPGRSLAAGPWLTTTTTRPAHGRIGAGERGILVLRSDTHLPLVHAAVEAVVRTDDNRERSLWARFRIRREAFDIGGGWVSSTAADGRSTLCHEPYLQVLALCRINTGNMGLVPGYNDTMAPGNLYDRYPIKAFHACRPLEQFDTPEMRPRIHGVEFLGEPQLGFGHGHRLPQQVWEAFLPYRNGGLPTTVTLSDESGFRFYAGIADFSHYDAYRVIAPAADSWRRYDRWPDGRRIGWGAPLEGVGTMTRELRDMSRPAAVAVWSQGPHDGWYSMDGRTRTSPTTVELRLQAYHALASRVTSLYWFNPSLRSLLAFPDLIPEMRRIGREIRLLEEFYLEGDADHYARVTGANHAPDWDLATIVAPRGAVLFALDLDYLPDPRSRTFVLKPPRRAAFEFPVPAWLGPDLDVFRVDADGVHGVTSVVAEHGRVGIEDRLAGVGIYIATPEPDLRKELSDRRHELAAEEDRLGFDPARNPEDLESLRRILTPRQAPDGP